MVKLVWTVELARFLPRSLTCHTFSFKADSVPTSGGCWLFNQPEVTVEADAKAVTGSKECQDPAMAESSDAGAVQDAVTDTAAAAGTVADGVKAATGSAEAGTDQVAAGVESAANMAAESVQSGIDSMNGGLNGLNGIAPGHLDSITDGITSASAGGHLNMQALSLKGGHVHESVTDIKVGPYAKSLLVDGSAGNDHTLLYGVLGGGAAAVSKPHLVPLGLCSPRLSCASQGSAGAWGLHADARGEGGEEEEEEAQREAQRRR